MLADIPLEMSVHAALKAESERERANFLKYREMFTNSLPRLFCEFP